MFCLYNKTLLWLWLPPLVHFTFHLESLDKVVTKSIKTKATFVSKVPNESRARYHEHFLTARDCARKVIKMIASKLHPMVG